MAGQIKGAATERGGLGLPVRASFEIGKTRRQRAAQYTRQMQVLGAVVVVAVVFGGSFAYLSWHGVGSTRSVSCADYPEYCVPLVGGGTGDALESASARDLDGDSAAAPGVVRGITDEGMPFLGDPAAPIRLVVIADYACSHCQDYHDSDLNRIIEDFVLTGQAQLQVGLRTSTGGAYSDLASQMALCAGEQGAFWEVHDELYRMAQSAGVATAFSVDNLINTAGEMGLDERAIRQCIVSDNYSIALNDVATFANDHGVSGTPTVLVFYPGMDRDWQRLDTNAGEARYDNLANLIERANAQ